MIYPTNSDSTSKEGDETSRNSHSLVPKRRQRLRDSSCNADQALNAPSGLSSALICAWRLDVTAGKVKRVRKDELQSKTGIFPTPQPCIRIMTLCLHLGTREFQTSGIAELGVPVFVQSCGMIITSSLSMIRWKPVTLLSTPLLKKLLLSCKEYIQTLFAAPNFGTERSKPSFSMLKNIRTVTITQPRDVTKK